MIENENGTKQKVWYNVIEEKGQKNLSPPKIIETSKQVVGTIIVHTALPSPFHLTIKGV